MIIVLKQDANPEKVKKLKEKMEKRGFVIQDIKGETTTMIGLAGDTTVLTPEAFLSLDFVKNIIKVQEPYKLVGRRFHPEDTIIDVQGRKIGGGNFAVIAGPCSVESEEQILSIARDVSVSGASFLRGGAFKPRTSPYAFDGLGMEGLELMRIARQKTGLPIVSEILSSEHLDAFANHVDIVQIGARNMQNFRLLHQVGELKKPVLLKRGLSSTINELLMAAEHVMVGGGSEIILCERGIRTFETATRNTLDISAVPVLKRESHLPVIVDPSHAGGYWYLVEPLALAGVAAGADGLILEVHNMPQNALCDGQQSITPEVFHRLMKKITEIYNTVHGK
ncbi:MAG: 3-deoxy-7-phosphoheptulonate synthase [Eubacteriales bacterium]|nr:3-deoxy-7-phosphoheptulonate synthase [Eubacteriales bacterium]MDD4583810.1 3-deoxy-7-phosphoheptulonate synthase [Eubacteriales bacterium]